MSHPKEEAFEPVTIPPPLPHPETQEPIQVNQLLPIEEQQFPVPLEPQENQEEQEEQSETGMQLHSGSGIGYDDPRTAGFRRTRNYQTEQQSLFIGLLNMVYNITIDHPRKRSKITLPFFTITRISTDKEVIELKEILCYRLEHLRNEDIKRGCTPKTAARRQEV